MVNIEGSPAREPRALSARRSSQLVSDSLLDIPLIKIIVWLIGHKFVEGAGKTESYFLGAGIK